MKKQRKYYGYGFIARLYIVMNDYTHINAVDFKRRYTDVETYGYNDDIYQTRKSKEVQFHSAGAVCFPEASTRKMIDKGEEIDYRESADGCLLIPPICQNGITKSNGNEQFNNDIDFQAESHDFNSESPSFLTLQKNMQPVLHAMQLLGFLPCSIPTSTPGSRASMQVKVTCFLRLVCVFYIFVNCGIFSFNVYITNEIKKEYGFLSMDCISSVMNGLKPCHGLLNLLILLVCCAEHRTLLIQMWAVDRAFRKYFNQSPNLRTSRNVIVGMYAAIFGITFTARLSQYIVYKEIPGANILSDTSLILVPCLSIWQVVPIVYFVFLTKIIRFWFLELQRQLIKDKKLIKKPLIFYYERFLQLTDVIVLVGATFNPLIFISLAMSVAILCLTIFFVTTAPEVLPTTMATESGFDFVTLFYLLWCSLQIMVAVIYVGTICIAGTLTNESARRITSTVLSVVPDSDRDRHVVMCFLQKIATQPSWGLTVWRAFPIERHLLFTLMSIMGTYAVVLLKLKQNKGDPCLTMSDLYRFVNHSFSLIEDHL